MSNTFALAEHTLLTTALPTYRSFSFGSTDHAVGQGPSPEIKAVGDLDNDGIDDLILDYYETSVQPIILLGSPSGEFQILAYDEPNAARRHIRNGELADFNNDGFLDFVGFTTGDPGERWIAEVGTDYGATIPRGQSDLVLINVGGTDFIEFPVPEVRINDWNHGGSTGDIDNDGFVDILPLSEGEQERTVPLRNVDGNNFALGDSEYGSDISFYLTPDLDTGDLNNDGLIDVVVALQNQNDRTPSGNNQLGMLRVIYGDEDFDFSNNQVLEFGEMWISQDQASQLANRDSEIVVGSGFSSGDVITGPSNVEVIDLDSDGLNDVLLGQFVTTSGLWRTAGFKFYRNTGDSFVDATDTFFPNQQTNRNVAVSDVSEFSAPYIHNFYQNDFNNDGFLDLVLQHDGKSNWHEIESNLNYPYLFLNSGNGQFLPVERSRVEDLVQLDDIVTGDFNGDGRADLLGIDAFSRPSDIDPEYDWVGPLQGVEVRTFLAPNSSVNQAVVSSFLRGTGRDDALTGDGANNIFIPGIGSDYIVAGDGVDTVIYWTDVAEFQLISSQSGIRVVHDLGDDSLSQVERLQFNDRNIAVDLDGSAGLTAKTLAAVIGEDGLSNKEYVGIGLQLFDAGQSLATVCELSLNAVGATTNEDVVTTLYSNLYGESPSDDQLQEYVELLDQGAFTKGSLAAAAAELTHDLGVIDLVGLAETGIEYA